MGSKLGVGSGPAGVEEVVLVESCQFGLADLNSVEFALKWFHGLTSTVSLDHSCCGRTLSGHFDSGHIRFRSTIWMLIMLAFGLDG